MKQTKKPYAKPCSDSKPGTRGYSVLCCAEQDKDGSDLDLLVDPLPGVTLFDLGGLQVELEEMLGVPVDLLTPEDLPLKYRQKVLLEALPI